MASIVTYGLVILISLILLFKIGRWAFPKTKIVVVNGNKMKQKVKVKKFVPILAWGTILVTLLAMAYSSYELGAILLTKPTPVKQVVTKNAGAPKKPKQFTIAQYTSASPIDLYNTYDKTGKKALDSFYEDQDEKNFGVSLIGKHPFATKTESITLTDLKGKKHVIGKGGVPTLIFVLSTDSDNSQAELSVANTLVNSNNNNIAVLVAFPISDRSSIEELYTKNSFTMNNVITYSGNGSQYTQSAFQNIFLDSLSISKVPSYVAIDKTGRITLAGYGYRDQDNMSQFVSAAFTATPLYQYMTKKLTKTQATLSSDTNDSSSDQDSSSSSSSTSSSTSSTSSSKQAKKSSSKKDTSAKKSSNPSLLGSSGSSSK